MAVHLTRIYTKAGDTGTTRLVNNEQVAKTDPRIAAYADVDECNAAIGVAIALGQLTDELRTVLTVVQNDLFDLGADLCAPERDGVPARRERLRISDAQTKRLEDEIDAMNAELTSLTSFVLPGGSAAAAALHVARTVCRRAERIMVELAALPGEQVSAPALKYVNRLSDLLFVASRYVNDLGRHDVLWVPGQNR
jgi:cob(I)alamin adenosyltransferase